MGIYATTTSFSNLLPYFLRGNTTTSDTTGESIITEEILNAESVVDSYVSARYSLPFVLVPPLIRTLSKRLTQCQIILGSYVQDGERDNDYWKAYCDQAYKTLESIRDGKTKLAITDGSILTPTLTNRFKSNNEDYTPIFGLDTSTAWVVDSDKLDAISDSRD